jgi:hypothetical protein
MESHMTVDNKTFYNTADICQLLISKEGEDFDDKEDASSPVKKKKDPNKSGQEISKSSWHWISPEKTVERGDSGRHWGKSIWKFLKLRKRLVLVQCRI